MPELKLLSERTGVFHGTEVVQSKYQIDDCYGLIHEIFGERVEDFSIKILKRNEYIPQIYKDEDIVNCEIYGFVIQTTSYGFLDKEEIDKMINGYQYALHVVELLEKKFALSLTKKPG